MIQAGGASVGRHILPVRIYYEDTDAAGVVYHANYLRYFERARSDMLRTIGLPPSRIERDHGIVFAVRRCAVDYLRPARLDELIEVDSKIVHMGGATIEMQQEACRDGQALVRMDVTLACVGRDGRAKRLPIPVRATIEESGPETLEERDW